MHHGQAFPLAFDHDLIPGQMLGQSATVGGGLVAAPRWRREAAAPWAASTAGRRPLMIVVREAQRMCCEAAARKGLPNFAPHYVVL